MREDFFHVHLTDDDIANFIFAGVVAAKASQSPHALVAAGVKAGRSIGVKSQLEPLDDGLRTVIDGALEIVRKHDPGMHGLILNLERLDRFLQRYACRGTPVELAVE
jgi:hypothetical protein